MEREAELSRYIQRLEGLFLQLRGRGVQWSPEDSARARAWFRQGLPLAAVVGAIEGRVKAFRYLNGNDAALPRHLGWYETSIGRNKGRFRLPGRATAGAFDRRPAPRDVVEAGEVGAAAGGAAATTLLELMDALPGLIEGAHDPALREAYRRGLGVLRRLAETAAAEASGDGPPKLDSAALDSGLRRCRATLVRTLLAGIGPSATAEIDADVAAKLTAEGATGASRKARQARSRVVQERLLGARFGLHLPEMDGWKNPDASASTGSVGASR